MSAAHLLSLPLVSFLIFLSFPVVMSERAEVAVAEGEEAESASGSEADASHAFAPGTVQGEETESSDDEDNSAEEDNQDEKETKPGQGRFFLRRTHHVLSLALLFACGRARSVHTKHETWTWKWERKKRKGARKSWRERGRSTRH